MQKRHPLLQPRSYTAKVAPLREAHDAVSLALETADVGMALVGPTRWGKSSFLDAFVASLVENRSAVVLRSTMRRDTSANWQNRLFRRLRGEEEIGNPLFGNKPPRDHLIEHILVECDRLEQPQVVFALDEFQGVTIPQLDAIKVLTENLIEKRLKPFVLSVAQPELTYLVALLKHNRRPDLVQRFFLRWHRFRGLQNAAELTEFLEHTDTAVWPVGSGRTFTQHFAPIAWERGWRIAREGQGLWQAFQIHAKRLMRESSAREIGVHFVAQAQLELLQRIGDNQSCVSSRGELASAHALHLAAVEESGFRLATEDRETQTSDPDELLKEALRWHKGLGRG